MASSSCPKCGKHSFEMVEIEPGNSGYILMSIQCSLCGAVVGIVDYYNIGTKTSNIEEKTSEIENQINQLSHDLDYNIKALNENMKSIMLYLQKKLDK